MTTTRNGGASACLLASASPVAWQRPQLALRISRPLAALSPAAAAETFRANPELDTERVILELKVGEALVSMLENKGEPSIVQRTLIRPPEGRIGPVTEAERRGIIAASPFNGKYDKVENSESAEEMLAGRATAPKEDEASAGGGWSDIIFGGKGPTGRRRQGVGEMVGRELTRSFSRQVASIIRSIIMKAIRGGR